ncbi:testis-expressed protein 49 [Scleropages formosus]|uniref:testis-expressed protein 49 n=1 Tax=Scleropages formosus TaxID=113540 RepID=UPI0010FA79CD|nr:testis-expressed protein 49 [Scleropages formosus]
MAFFGITSLGYQDPFAGRKLSSPPETSADPGVETNARSPSESTKQAATSYTHNGSQQKFKEMLKRNQMPRAPNQLYRVPLTDNQQYGWWIEKKEPWMNVSHFPCKNSEMTKFANEMSMTDREFSLF